MKTQMHRWSVHTIAVIVLLLLPSSVLAEPNRPFQGSQEDAITNNITVDMNDFELRVQASGNGSNVYGYAPLVAFVTYQGAGVAGLTSEMFSISTTPQVVPAGASALLLDSERFNDWGDGRYSLGLKPANDEWATGTYHMVLAVDARPQFKAGGMTIVVIQNE